MGYIGTKPSAVPLTSADITDGIITSAKIADGTIVNADINASAGIVQSKLSGSFGITEADMFRITSNFSYTGAQGAVVLSSNWERVDSNSFDKIGTGITQSSGVFTFPSTGIYLITFNFHAEGSNTNNNRFIVSGIEVSTDGTAFNASGDAGTNALGNTMGTDTRASGVIFHQFDVTNVSTHKVRFFVACNNNNVTFFGNTNQSFNYVNFIRLGDT